MSTTMSRVTAKSLDASYGSATAGDAPGVISAPANNDLVPISSGSGTLLTFITSGTGATVVISNVVAPPYGTGGDVTVTLAATDIQQVWIRNDGRNRFDQGGGSAGFVKLTYTTPTALKVYAVTIP